MKKIVLIIVIAFILIFSLITINSCSTNSVKNQEDANNKVVEVGEDIGDIADEIDDINQDLG